MMLPEPAKALLFSLGHNAAQLCTSLPIFQRRSYQITRCNCEKSCLQKGHCTCHRMLVQGHIAEFKSLSSHWSLHTNCPQGLLHVDSLTVTVILDMALYVPLRPTLVPCSSFVYHVQSPQWFHVVDVTVSPFY